MRVLERGAISSRALRMEVGSRHESVRAALETLVAQGLVRRKGERWEKATEAVPGSQSL